MWARFILTGWCLLLLVSKTSSSPGTTPNIKQIFIGRCWEYLQPGNLRKFQLNQPSVTNCTKLWSTFSDAWIRKNPETIRATDYLPFLNAAKQQDIEKILLWSGTYVIAHEYSRYVSDYVTLEDTFLGYLVNGLAWCGIVCSNCPGINYDSCPEKAGRTYWEGASATFARSLKENGSVELMLYGSNPLRVAFNETSVASTSELPNLPKSSSIHTILVHAIGITPTERCDNGSLVKLKEKLGNLSFTFECTENPPDVVHLLCANVPEKKECLFHNEINCGTNSAPSVLKYLCLCIAFMFFTSL